jgi:hypothetical protein
MSVGQMLEASNEAFGEFRRRGLIAGIAEIDATTQRACLPRRTSALRILPRARIPAIERPRCLARPTQEKLDLEGRDEQGMSIRAEVAAPTTELTDWAEPGNLGVELVIERAKLSPVSRCVARIVGTVWTVFGTHFGVMAIEDWISERE